ncbi:DUF2330 domain-containing protein [Cellulosimicrobium arenosum]|uniref:DUF2330 domain-containing protein n=1 Tax=Cellulosimicrobium arenosum TaxID=2708133 RepID=A0A927J0K5_9MICO|nr:DUF2330 domain-containing protein [Cellulosimicrobium arenosum]MBD8079648.1 DUF2330 domain-containing protein [Cellulosimicrobium arenosum]
MTGRRRQAVRKGARAVLVGAALAAGAVVGAPPASACACGAVVDSAAYESAVTAETAALLWDGETETVLLELAAFSTAPEVGLLLPTPAPAEVALADPEIFRELDEVTAPRPVVSEHRWWPELSFGLEDGSAGGAPSVAVLDEVRLGPLDVTTLAATDAKALRSWLAEREFELSPSIEKALAPYVEEKWSFVAARLAPEAAGQLDGTLQPLRVTFPSDTLVYPMRMSSAASAEQRTRTYVLADHRMNRSDETARTTAPEVRYAGRVDAGSVRSAELAALLAQGPYVTAYEQTFTDPGAEIVSDFTFAQAPTDATVAHSYAVVVDKRVGPFLAGPVLAFGGVLVLAALLVWGSRRHRAALRVPAVHRPVRA